jgi:hypothetical protein
MVSLSVVIPATNQPPTLERVLAAVKSGLDPERDEVIVIRQGGRSPARARNEGARSAKGDVLVFIDADVLVQADALDRIRQTFGARPELGAVFGSYDATPECSGLPSTFRNLLHHYVHSVAAGPAVTFWAGLGAVRREVFLRHGGFDPRRYPRPMLEDVEFGLRLSDAGEAIELDPSLQAKHVREWSFKGMVRTDVLDRGTPWTRLLVERRSAPATLNLGWSHRLSALSVVLGTLALLGRRFVLASALAAVFATLNRDFYALVHRTHGWRLAIASPFLHAVHHLSAVASLPLGVVAHIRRGGGFAPPEPLTEKLDVEVLAAHRRRTPVG